MAGLEDLRKKSATLREAVLKNKAERVKSAVQEVVSSEAFDLSWLDAETKQESLPTKTEQVVDKITNEVCKVVLNPVNDFIDICKARGMTNTRIKKAVGTMNSIFELTDSEEYEAQLEAVANYMENNQNLYDDIPMFNRAKG